MGMSMAQVDVFLTMLKDKSSVRRLWCLTSGCNEIEFWKMYVKMSALIARVLGNKKGGVAMKKNWWSLSGKAAAEVEIELTAAQGRVFAAMITDEETIKRVWFAYLMDGAAMRDVTWVDFHHMYIHMAAIISQLVAR